MVQTFDTDFYIALLLEACHNFTQTSHRISQDLREDSNGASTARRVQLEFNHPNELQGGHIKMIGM